MFFVFHTRRFVCKGVSADRAFAFFIDDASAAAYADERIMEIGTVTLESSELINIARDYYNSLTTAQKKLVTKLSTLEAAEKTLRALKDAHNAQYTTYLFAQYDTKGLVIDGELSEAIWRTPQTIFGVGKLGATWDFNYLYLGFTGSKTLPFLMNGGLSLILHAGLGIIGRLLTYETFAMNLKKEFTENYDWYLYNLSIKKDAQGKGLASKLIRPMLQFCDDERILEVNRAFLQHDYYTDIITFDYCTGNTISGDLFISLDTVKTNSQLVGESYERELYRVIIHGILHLCGINDKGEGEREIMERCENEALAMRKA